MYNLRKLDKGAALPTLLGGLKMEKEYSIVETTYKLTEKELADKLGIETNENITSIKRDLTIGDGKKEWKITVYRLINNE